MDQGSSSKSDGSSETREEGESKMDVKKLLKELWGDNPLDGIKKFNAHLASCEDKKAFIKEFLQRSWCSEILRTFGNKSRKHGQLKIIIECLASILSNLSLEIPKHKEVAMKITVYMVETKEERIYEVLEDGRIDRIKVGLRCLQAMASIGGEVACRVIKFLAKPHKCYERIVNFRDVTMRKCFKQLLFEFLTSDDPYILDQFLMESDLLPRIFPSLKYGDVEEVLLVLNTLYEQILLNPDVNKKRKILFFTPETVRHLMNLYTWRGPGTESAEIEKTDSTENEVKIRRALLRFMVTLCSSCEHGIVVKLNDAKNGSNPNSNIYRIISDVKKPWETTDGIFLMSRVIAACPELFPKYLDSLKNLLFPRSSAAFVSLMEMLIEIIKHQKPWQFIESMRWQSVVSCIFPGFPLNQSFYLKLCQSDHSRVRFVGCTLMLNVLKKTKETMENLKNSDLPNDVYEKIKLKLTEKISSTFGKGVVKSMTASWNCILQRRCMSKTKEEVEHMEEDDDSNECLTDEILVIIEYLNQYTDISSSLIEVLSPVDVLRTLQYVNNLESNEFSQSTWAKSDFWTPCLTLLYKSINHRKFSIGVENFNENVFHTIIETNAHCLRIPDFTSHCLENKTVCCNLADILSLALDKAGISDDAESVCHWLRHIKGSNYVKLSIFLTHIIQQTIRSYNHYTDLLIEIKEKHTKQNSVPCLLDSDPFTLYSRWVSVIPGYNKPFSRFVLAAADLITANPDDEHKQYFSFVLRDYIHSLYNPGLLMYFLREKSSIINDELNAYIAYFFNSTKLPKSESCTAIKDSDLTYLLETSFMTEDFSLVNTYLESEGIDNALQVNMHLLVLQILLYMFVEHKKADNEGLLVGKAYIEILKTLYVRMKGRSEESAEVIVKSVLEHPRVIMLYNPIEPNEFASSLSQYFIEAVFEKHPNLSLYAYPYYLEILSSLKSTPVQEERLVQLSNVLIPFVTSEGTILSYEDIEDLCLIYLKLPCLLSPSCCDVLLQAVSLLLKVTTPRKQPQEETLHLLFNKYLEWISKKRGEKCDVPNDLLVVMESLLPQIMTTKVAEQISYRELKKLLHCGPRSVDICCQLVKLCPPHGLYFVSKLKDKVENLPDLVQLVSVLLGSEECSDIVQELLPKFHEHAKEWAVTLTNTSQFYEDIFMASLKADTFDADDLIDICLHTYKVTSEKELPLRNLSYLELVFEKISGSPVEHKLPFNDSDVCFLLVLLNVMKSAYKKDGQNNALVLNCCHMVETVLQDIDSDKVKASFAENKFWISLVKQVLRYGLNDIQAGPKMIHLLSLLIKTMYVNEYKIDVLESHNDLSLDTIYQMIISHTQYLHLMFQRESEWDKLKESVVELQQTIVNHNKSVCLEKHIPVLLGAYGASMSAVDQKILKLLHTYEALGVMNKYQPVLWGDAAVTHFGTHASTETYEEPQSKQIISLLKSDRMLRTCQSFDTSLPLEPADVHGDDRTIYDMRFLIPLLLYVSRDEKLLEIDFAESGAVAVGFTCLSSHHKEIWAAGATILKRVVDKMNSSRHIRFKLPWEWTIKIVVNSFDGKQHRLPSIILHFLLHGTRLLSCPQDPMYFIILKSLIVRPTIDILRVPQFSRLYISEDVFDSRQHLLFLLNFLSTGIRYPEDYYICQKTSTATLIMSLLQSPTADYEVKEQVLKVLESIVSIPVGAHELVTKYNILMMLPVALKISSPSTSDDDSCISVRISSVTSAVVRVLAAIWPSMLTAKDKETFLTRRLDFNPVGKRKIIDIDANSDDDEDEDDSSTDTSSLSEDDDEGPATKKLKDDVGSISRTKNDAMNKENRNRKLHPLFVEDYLNCLLCISCDVIKYAQPEYVAKHIELIICTLRHLFKNSSLEKETIRTVAQNPDILKERVYSSFPWESIQKRLEDFLTEDEQMRVLSNKDDEYMQKWRKEPLSKLLKRKSIADCVKKNVSELKLSTFNLLDTLER